jgi:hypothetical protein
MLTFEGANFNMGYNCIQGRTILINFMVVIHMAHAIMKLPGPKGAVTIKSNARDELTCNNSVLKKVGHTHYSVLSTTQRCCLASRMHGLCTKSVSTSTWNN